MTQQSKNDAALTDSHAIIWVAGGTYKVPRIAAGDIVGEPEIMALSTRIGEEGEPVLVADVVAATLDTVYRLMRRGRAKESET